MYKNILAISVGIFSSIHCGNFNDAWNSAQIYLQQLENRWSTEIAAHKTSYWEKTSNNFKRLVNGAPNNNFLSDPDIQNAMYRSIPSISSKYEAFYLKNFLSQKNRELLANFIDNDPFSPAYTNVPEFNCSVSTLGHLFYVFRILEVIKNLPENPVIVEVGGGYGNLARIFKKLLPKCTYVIFDLPETLAIQTIFLESIFDTNIIEKHIEAPKSLATEKINLIPTFDKKSLNIQPDILISNFAITETPEHIQKEFIALSMFHSRNIYFTGQINGWHEDGFAWIQDHSLLVNYLRSKYTNNSFMPLTSFFEQLRSFELICYQN